MVRIAKKVEPGNTSSGESRAEDIGVSRDGLQIQVDISIGLMLIQNIL